MNDLGELSLTGSRPRADTARLAIAGDLDHTNADQLTKAVEELLGEHGAVRWLRLDCAGLQFCDSYGLASLLMVRRLVTAASAELHLDNRARALERLLVVTHTVEYLTGACDDRETEPREARPGPLPENSSEGGT
ncbi:anti-sigma-factor antagonist [Pseudonocardia ammonioxydans]|uniref:Anti-sigma-factor antagonist n=1 Tax=Pseudonocardia ammonioxydans TaxID=260086 RepID=A0A1I5CV64_PSUAM|nr:STAS domain-containing protein [Pseudonocardia ammonioxydans]SFN90854.1 anti-sigma-factor antagonist [Pseudonocardia ammonioxydans]